MNPLTREWIFWGAALACALGEAAIIVSSVRSLRSSGRANAARETMWAVIPAIALVWLLTVTWTAVQRGSAHERMNMPMPTTGA